MAVLKSSIIGILLFAAGPNFAAASTSPSCEGKLHPYRVCDAFADLKDQNPSCDMKENSAESIRRSAEPALQEDLLGRARFKRLTQFDTNGRQALKVLECSLTLQSLATSAEQKRDCSERMSHLKSYLRLLIPRVRQALFLSGSSPKIKHTVHGSSPIPPMTEQELLQAEARRKRDLQSIPKREPSFAEKIKSSVGGSDRTQMAYNDEYETLVAQAPFVVYFAQSSIEQDPTDKALTDAISKWYANLETERKQTLNLTGDQRLALFLDRNLINEMLLETKPSLTKEACDQARKLFERAQTEARHQELLSFGVTAGGAGVCAMAPPACPYVMGMAGAESTYLHLRSTQERYQNTFAQFLNGTGCRGDLKRATDDRNLALLMIPLTVSGAGGAARAALKPQAAGALKLNADELVESSFTQVAKAADTDAVRVALNGFKGQIDESVTRMSNKEIYEYLDAWVKRANTTGDRYLPGLSPESSPKSFSEMLKDLELGNSGKDHLGNVTRTLYNNTSVIGQVDELAQVYDAGLLKTLLSEKEIFESALPGRVFQEFIQRTRGTTNKSWDWSDVPIEISPARVRQGMDLWRDPDAKIWP